MAVSKSLQNAYDQIDRNKRYSLEEAVKFMKKHNTVKFDATAEIHFTLGIDPKHAEQQIRSTVKLPHGTGKSVKVIAFCEDDKVKKAKAAGAMEAGKEDLIDKVSKGWTEFDIAVATPDLMKDLAKIARVLGPKGLMPSPKAGTVTQDLEKTIGELVAGRLEVRNDKNGVVHTIFGKLSFDEKKLLENLQVMVNTVRDLKPASIKGIYIKNIAINSTMGAGIKLEIPA